MGFPSKSDYIDDIDVDATGFDRLPTAATIERTIDNIENRNVGVEVFKAKEDAREFLSDQIERGAEVCNGTSTTLNEIGFTDVLEDADGFHYLWHDISEIDDDETRLAARRRAQTADIWFDSPNAIASTGEILGVNASGSGVGAWPYAAERLVLVSGTNKIVPTFEDALARCREFALPLEESRARDVYGSGSTIGKLVSLEQERFDGRTTLVLIKERLGF